MMATFQCVRAASVFFTASALRAASTINSAFVPFFKLLMTLSSVGSLDLDGHPSNHPVVTAVALFVASASIICPIWGTRWYLGWSAAPSTKDAIVLGVISAVGSIFVTFFELATPCLSMTPIYTSVVSAIHHRSADLASCAGTAAALFAASVLVMFPIWDALMSVGWLAAPSAKDALVLWFICVVNGVVITVLHMANRPISE
ncbi:hypothetical protein B0T25DRAFT_178891 [Lasiosphaeria hispida]|uniref:Uncharacterized protein n=1 Tax=Lasiosphaeria hispida TaxID=260671 RepID=A0AAJ0MD75_9PEZI|nr:hypothetical protein B0T25DRAFT_178891 [Lasiosphaeria hispida]